MRLVRKLHHYPVLAQARKFGQCLLSASIFFVSAIARAGLRPLGQVWVQFMMVWQRYRRNGSSRSSRRSPVASSLLSTSQRYAASRVAGPRKRSLFHQ